jgi:hypothetical protein
MCSDLLDTAVQINVLNFILYKHYKNTRCLSEDNKGVCPEPCDASVVDIPEFRPLMLVIVLLDNEPIKCERSLTRQVVIKLKGRTTKNKS